MLECQVSLHDGVCFIAQTGSGHLVAMDGAPDAGGQNRAPRPMELLLAGVGGCTAYDVVTILRRGRQAISACVVKLSAERAPTDPKVLTQVNMHFSLRGHHLKPEAVARAIALSAEKYCSASIMIGKTAQITHSWEIIEDDTNNVGL
jgi:putative redox protein